MPNDKVKNGDTLEYWLTDSLYGIEMTEEQIAKLVSILNPLREQIEEAMKLYDPKIDNWKHFRNALWTAIPRNIDNRVARTVNEWFKRGTVKDLKGPRDGII